SAFANGGDPDLAYFRSDDEFWVFDAEALEATPLGFAEHGVSTSSLRALEAFPADDHDVIACFRQNGEAIVFDPSADEVVVHDVAVDSAPVIAHSIGLGPDGDVWVGAYLSAGVIATIDVHSREITQLEGPEQSSAIATVGPYLMISKYPDGVLYRYDSREPWEWDSNPDIVAELISPHLQDRLFEMTDAGRSEEHTSELQSRFDLVCRLLRRPACTLFPYTTLFRSWRGRSRAARSPPSVRT